MSAYEKAYGEPETAERRAGAGPEVLVREESAEPAPLAEAAADGRHRAGGGGGRTRGRAALLTGAGVVLVGAVSTVAALGLGGGEGDGGGSGAPDRSGRTVAVARTTLAEKAELDGRLGYGPAVPFAIRAQGTVTRLPAEGAVLRRGGEVLRVDDRPVTLLYGALPVYRELGLRPAGAGEPAGGGRIGGGTSSGGGTGDGSGVGATATGGTVSGGGTAKGAGTSGGAAPGAGGGTGSGGGGGQAGGPQGHLEGRPEGRAAVPGSAPGPRTRTPASAPLRGQDVQQFERNLSALGYGGFTVDDTFTERTEAAVERWQQDIGVPRTGRIAVGDVVYAPGPVRISGVGTRPGAQTGGEPATYTSTTRMVTVDAKAAELTWAARGRAVSVDLPDGRTVPGRVASVGTSATAAPAAGPEGGGGDGPGDPTVSVTVTFADPDAVGRIDSGPVTVRYTSRERKDVLAVPVAALVALAEGGHGLELAEGGGAPDDGSGRFTAVTTGLFADGRVEVRGTGVREGTKVRIPE
ncbi:peptidoglycan-binding domain-containing protein [Streptomyces sp. NPDC006798]|uniref:peptidoglycan-binding domain-containing protein n=1 Tax=Streptomyces sp. NPDC006798 TaxID=3155462 RepID=UPI003409EF37